MTRKEEYLEKLDALNKEYSDVLVHLPKSVGKDELDSATDEDLQYTMSKFLTDLTDAKEIAGPDTLITSIQFGYFLENSETERVITVRGDFGSHVRESRDIITYDPTSISDIKNILANWTVFPGRRAAKC